MYASTPPVRLVAVARDTCARTGAITRVELPSATLPGTSPIPCELRTGPDGRIWLSELHGGRVVARDGTIWIPLYSAGELVALDPATGATTRYALPDRDALPYVVRVDDARDIVWVGTGASDAIYRLDRTTRRFETFPCRRAARWCGTSTSTPAAGTSGSPKGPRRERSRRGWPACEPVAS